MDPTAHSDLQSALKEYGSLFSAFVTAGVAFIGVMITVAVNAYLARRADHQRRLSEQEAEEREIKHEQRILRYALRGELKNLQRILKEEVEFDTTNDFTWVPLLDFFNVYKENINKLGLLTSDEVEALSTAYYTFKEEAGYISFIAGADPAPSTSVGFVVYDMRIGERPERPAGLTENESKEKRAGLIGSLNCIICAASKAEQALESAISANLPLEKPSTTGRRDFGRGRKVGSA